MSNADVTQIENYWKAKTTASNNLFNRGKYEEALLGYNDALYRAEILNNRFADCIQADIPFIQVYIISCNNIANTYTELGKKEEAANMLKRAVYYLLHLSGNTEIKQEEVQNELRRAAVGYISFIEKNEETPNRREALFHDLKKNIEEQNLMMQV